MLEKVYDSWQIITIISTIIGVISVLVGFGKFFSKWEKLHKAIRILGTTVIIAVCALVCFTGMVGYLFTEVPRVRGGDVNEAETKLHNAGLTMALDRGINLKENWSSQVAGQSIDEYSIVPKGTKVIIYLNAVQTDMPDVQGIVSVPNVVGMEQIEATELLTESGLQFQVWWTEENNIEAEQYYVISQSIPADSEVPAGTLVKLELSPNKP